MSADGDRRANESGPEDAVNVQVFGEPLCHGVRRRALDGGDSVVTVRGSCVHRYLAGRWTTDKLGVRLVSSVVEGLNDLIPRGNGKYRRRAGGSKREAVDMEHQLDQAQVSAQGTTHPLQLNMKKLVEKEGSTRT
jgi:hypothetical protein